MKLPVNYFMSDSVVVIRRRHIAMAGEKKARGVSFAPLMKPCLKAFAPGIMLCFKLIIISPRILTSLEESVPAIVFFRSHPMQGRRQQFKLLEDQIKEMFQHGTPSFYMPALMFGQTDQFAYIYHSPYFFNRCNQIMHKGGLQ